MTVDNALINRLSKLSSLEISEDKVEDLKLELEEIVEFVDNINEVDVSNVDATFTTVDGGAILREDIAFNNNEISNHIMKNSPKSENGYFVVPKII